VIEAAERPAELADPDCLADGEAAALLAGHPWRRFAVLGDSVANGPIFEVPGFCPLRWTDRVATELRAEAPEFSYLNLGVSGLLTRQVRDSQLAEALDFGPDLALVLCGGNDAFRASYTEQRARQVDLELAEILQPLRDSGAQLATICIFDVSYSPAIPDSFRPGLRERLARLAEHARATAERFDCVHVDLARHRRACDPTLYSPDGRHGNSRSDAIAAAELVRALGARLAIS
jgi:lysophospholipase L1-like esterase